MSDNSHRVFNVGDGVIVCMSSKYCFPFQAGPRFAATITYGPQDVGDLWGLVTEEGEHIRLNPNSSDFIGFVSVKRAGGVSPKEEVR